MDVICATYGQRRVPGWVIVTSWVIVTCRVIGVTAANRAIRDCGMVPFGIPVPCGVWGYRCRPVFYGGGVGALRWGRMQECIG